jgi:RNA polymerase sigma-70 factor, ECF subfamily
MDDQILIEQFRQSTGHERDKAFNQIVLRYRERLYAIIRGYVRDHDDTDDILQETYMKAFLYLHKFRGESSLYTWLTRIAINLSLTHIRKMKLRSWITLDQVTIPLISKNPAPDAEAEHNELKDMIHKALERLPEKQKTVFILRHYDHRSIAEIAEITGNAEGTVKANYFHALNKVKKSLEKTLKKEAP